MTNITAKTEIRAARVNQDRAARIGAGGLNRFCEIGLDIRENGVSCFGAVEGLQLSRA